MVKREVLIRDTSRKEVYAVMMDLEKDIGVLKRKIASDLRGVSPSDIFLYHKGIRLSEDHLPKFYGIESNDLLVLKEEPSYDSNLKEDMLEDYEYVEEAKRWLEQNIGLSELDLEKYERVVEDDRRMIFRSEGLRYKLTLSEDGIDDYVALSS